ncbi:MAG: preprotein translocase subunit SecA [Chloroflexi bacterium]|nr:MAG: preprotein translocase subunit SecA [Chloroflexota bacterium]
MIKRLYNAIVGDPNEKEIKRLWPNVDRINELEKEFKDKSDDELRAMTDEFKGTIAEATAELRALLDHAQDEYIAVAGTDEQRFARLEVERLRKELLQQENALLDEILPEAFAAVREASKRTTGLRHYDVQLIGGMVLHRGKIAEMRTGEGKTLVATLPLYLNALTGRGVHLVTPNDYLSKVGLQLMGPIYRLLGLNAAVIQNSAGNPDMGSFVFDPDFPAEDDRFQTLRPISRPEAYQADVLYGTNNEFGFDYLRDNMVMEKERRAQRELHYAIVDEVDNILIDEARTPLIISGESQDSSDYYRRFAEMVRSLRAEEDYEINEKERTATLTEEGIARIESRLGIDNLYDSEHFDMLPYLDNALRAKALYAKDRDYIVRQDEVVIVDEFTGRLMEGRRYGEGLHQAIEAKEGVKVKKESMTLATITFQNFFRMFNKLAGMTGTAKTEEEEFQSIYNLDVIAIPTYKPVIRDDRADVVYKSQKSKFEAVMKEIEEAHKREQPILLGTVAIETSELVSRMLERKGIPHEVLNAKNHEREATIIAQAGQPGAVTIATNMAGRGVDILLGGNYEGMARDQLRKEGVELTEIPTRAWNACLDMVKKGEDPTQKYQTRWAEVIKERYDETRRDQKKVIAAGGLHVVGTERHEARRIDNQLRGRSGRLGDPGSSRFFLSLEDDLVRRFGGDRITGIMERLGLEDDIPIEAGMISKAIESAQTRVEGHNFDIRKHVLKYDGVVNEQRETIYAERRRILLDPSLKNTISDMIEQEIEQVVRHYTSSPHSEEWELDEMVLALRLVFPFPDSFSLDEWDGLNADEITERAVELALAFYAHKEEEIGADLLRDAERQVMLHAVDHRWVRHLTDLDRLREGIGLQALAQVDPLVAYKRQAFGMYQELMGDIRSDIVKSVMALRVEKREPVIQKPIAANIRTNRDGESGAVRQQTVRNTNNKPGRNDPCWCGSGKKYKQCHMQEDSRKTLTPAR